MTQPKHPHPSGRPIRRDEKKARTVWYQYPAETFALPRLRPKPLIPVADAIGYKTVDQSRDEPSGSIGFVRFRP